MFQPHFQRKCGNHGTQDSYRAGKCQVKETRNCESFPSGPVKGSVLCKVIRAQHGAIPDLCVIIFSTLLLIVDKFQATFRVPCKGTLTHSRGPNAPKFTVVPVGFQFLKPLIAQDNLVEEKPQHATGRFDQL